MGTTPYFEQIEQNINMLLSDKKYKEAYKLCVDFLNKFPEERTFIKLKEKIEEEVADENAKIIEEKINSTSKFFETKNYAEILRTLQPLLKLAPNHKRLQKEILQAQELYKDQIEDTQESFLKKQREKLEKILKENPELILDELIYIERNQPGNHQVENLINEYKEKYINKKIDEKKELINSDKFDSIYHFIEQLRKVDDKNATLNNLETKIKNRQHGNQIDETKEFVFSSENHLLTLMKIKKYDKAIKVAEEILESDKNNTRVAKILKEAQDKFYSQSRDTVAELIVQTNKTMDNEYQQNKDGFITL